MRVSSLTSGQSRAKSDGCRYNAFRSIRYVLIIVATIGLIVSSRSMKNYRLESTVFQQEVVRTDQSHADTMAAAAAAAINGKAPLVSLPVIHQTTTAATTTAMLNTTIESSRVSHIHLDPIRQAIVSKWHSQNQLIQSKDVSTTYNGQTHHILFSTGCSKFQDWQSYVLFYQAWAIGQPGYVVRIASGCNAREEAALQVFHQRYIATLSDRFSVHFTPHFGRIRDHSTQYWNKPFGVKHWLEHSLKYAGNATSIEPNVHDDGIIVLMDPDQILLKPLVNDFSSTPIDEWLPYYHTRQRLIRSKVEHGKPIATQYEYGAMWLTQVQNNLTDIVGKDSRVHNITDKMEAYRFYTCGPPYILTTKDMFQLSIYWSGYVAQIYDLLKDFMAEMFAYSMAAAHLGFVHQNGRGFMASNHILTEGWPSFEKDPELKDANKACGVLSQPQPDVNPDYRPYVLHYCQEYALGDIAFFKYNFPGNTITRCSKPMYETLPPDAIGTLDYSRKSSGRVERHKLKTTGGRNAVHRQGHALCTLLPIINRAAIDFKIRRCDVKTANFNETWSSVKKKKGDK